MLIVRRVSSMPVRPEVVRNTQTRSISCVHIGLLDPPLFLSPPGLGVFFTFVSSHRILCKSVRSGVQQSLLGSELPDQWFTYRLCSPFSNKLSSLTLFFPTFFQAFTPKNYVQSPSFFTNYTYPANYLLLLS